MVTFHTGAAQLLFSSFFLLREENILLYEKCKNRKEIYNMKHTQDMKPETKFGRWLLDMMGRYNYTCGDVAKELGTTRQNVRNHIIGVTKPSFVWVIAYCWMFNSTEDIYDVWHLTTEEES